ncbi:secreted protein [Ophiocordyceps camponoti-floridani]|uniref:Secreted protein n=1 Tax=Ophiocordyceps camponoti-floridani TaxID=2030778 RepID=A0A8H4VB35_9HYPO|nr:secreted protein [Ophiocordyceps camponoti-floridani]
MLSSGSFLTMMLPMLTILLGLASAAPQPGDLSPNLFTIRDIGIIGSGCSQEHDQVYIDKSGTVFEVSFSDYGVESGPDVRAKEWRKNCKLSLNLEYSRGFQFRLVGTNMAGYAAIPWGSSGQCVNSFSFAGNGADRIDYIVKFRGPLNGRFDLESTSGLSAWSSCGKSSSILNLNTACNIDQTDYKAYIAVDEVSGKMTVKCGIEWRRC